MNFGRTTIAIVAALTLAACASPEERAAGYVKKAQEFYASTDYVKAKLEAQNALQIEPKNSDARYLLALMAEEEGDYRAMYGHLQVAVDSDPSDVDARIKLGNLQFMGRLYDDAAEQRDALLEMAPEDARVRLLNARLLIQQGERDAAIEEIGRAVELDPGNVEAVAFQASVDSVDNVDQALLRLDEAIARIDPQQARELRELRIAMLRRENRKAEVEAELAALARDFPGDAGYEERLARFYAEEGRVDDAERLLRRVAEANPSDAKRIGYVEFLATQKDIDQAEAALKAFIGETPDAGALRLALGQLYEQTRRPDDARRAYEELAASDPRSEEGVTARVRLAALNIASGDGEAALQRVDGVLADVPDHPEALLLRATLRFTEQRFTDAIADLRGVLRRMPNDERALLLLAQVYVQQADMVLAKDTYRRLLDAKPESAEGLQSLALLLARDGDFGEAETLLRRRLEAAPDDVRAGTVLVQVLLQRERFDEAEQEARRLGGSGNRTGLAELALADVLSATGRHAEAAEAYRKAVDARPGDSAALNSMVRAYATAGRAADALPVLQHEAERGGEASVQARYLMTDVYRQTGQMERAQELLDELVRERPEDVQPYILMAAMHLDDAERRVAAYRRGLDAHPGDPRLGMLLGSEYARAGDHDRAITVFDEVVQKNPDAELAVNNLAALLLDHRDDRESLDRALQLAKRLEGTDNPVLLDTLGWAYYRTGQHQEAVNVLERVVARAQDQPTFNYHLGMAYLATGNQVGARQQLEQAMAANQEFDGSDEARAALARL